MPPRKDSKIILWKWRAFTEQIGEDSSQVEEVLAVNRKTMKNVKFAEQIGRSWLTCEYDGKIRAYDYPPIQGTHQECYSVINADSEIVPAEGLDMALITHGAFSSQSAQWQDVRNRCFGQNYVRIPNRLSWIPDKCNLAGIFMERDIRGEGLSVKINVPDVSRWKDENGIYINGDKSIIFVPRGQYRLGEHTAKSFESDGFSRAIFGDEGAEIYAKTAVDNKRTLWIFGIDISSINKPKGSVPLLESGDGYKLNLYGYDIGGKNFAFGVRAETK